MKKIVLLAFILVFLSTAMIVGFVRPVVAEETIYIKSDGSVEGTDKIQRDGNIYTFTDNIVNQSIVVERDNIVVDGADYTLQGTGSLASNGIYLSGRSNVTIKNMEIKAFGCGIYLVDDSSNNLISGNNITSNTGGTIFFSSSSNTVSENNITNNGAGICLFSSSNYNSVSGNNITDNGDGIYLGGSSNNIISGNNITDNIRKGILLELFSNNKFYHNNFINNTQHVYTPSLGYANFWDGGFEGNYWSNYTGVDSDYDGIGDSPHEIDADNIDNYPLMGMFHSFSTPLGYYVNVISNSTIEDFTFFESNSTIRMYISNSSVTQSFGFCRVCIPKDLSSPPYTVIIDDGLTEVLYFNGTVYDNGTHRWIYFAYEHSTHEVEIIPEFPTWTSILLILTVLTFAIVIYKRKLLKTPIH